VIRSRDRDLACVVIEGGAIQGDTRSGSGRGRHRFGILEIRLMLGIRFSAYMDTRGSDTDRYRILRAWTYTDKAIIQDALIRR
jgi:hypothetical protein